MRNAIILHGSCDKEEYFSNDYPSLSNSHWLPWLQKQLLINGVPAQTPEIPDAYKPEWQAWKKEFERLDIQRESVLVGHSCGGGFLVRWLSENKIGVNKLILVAPWLDPSNRRTSDFFNFQIDPALQERVDEIHILLSKDEETEGVNESVDEILATLPQAKLHMLNNMGHFTLGEMGTEEFPELLELIL